MKTNKAKAIKAAKKAISVAINKTHLAAIGPTYDNSDVFDAAAALISALKILNKKYPSL